MTEALKVELVACAAPLATRVGEFASAISKAGWMPSITLSPNAQSWINESTMKAVSQHLKQGRSPGEPRRSARPDAVVLIPATFNTLNKLRAGISDTVALGVLNDAVGAGVPLLVVPMVNTRLSGHPAWHATFEELSALGVTFLDPTTGRRGSPAPLISGAGDDVAKRFEAVYLTTWLDDLAL